MKKFKLKYSKRILKATICLGIIFLFQFNSIFAQASNESKRDTIHIVVSADIVENMNRTDVLAAMELWVGEMIQDVTPLDPKISPTIAHSIDEINQKVKENKADILGLFSLDYIKYKSILPIRPVMVLQSGSEAGTRYVLITKKDTDIKLLSDLKSKRILTIMGREQEIVNEWLFVKMKRENIANPLEIIEKFEEIEKQSKGIFSVFFDNADGCILRKNAYDSMCMLNPQLSESLKIFHESPPFLTQIYCVNNFSIKPEVQNTMNYIDDINRTKNGNKVLKLFKIVKVVGFEKKDLESLEKLWKDYNFYKRQ
jgi:phosphonate ABC transporter substrate-binding protein